MSREEWLDYFETVNGRKPSEDEVAKAKAKGDFTDDDTANVPQTSESQPATITQTPLPIPNKKTPVKWIILGIVAGVVLIAAAVGGFFGYRYVTGDINGSWHNTTLEKTVQTNIDSAIGDSSLLDGFISDAKVNLEVKNGTAVMQFQIRYDYEAYYKNIQSYWDSLGLSSDLSSELSVDDLKEEFNDGFATIAENVGGSFDEKTGVLTLDIFRGRVNQMAHTITVTWTNDTLANLASDSNQSFGIDALKAFKVAKGASLSYEKSGQDIHFSNEKEGTFTKK